MFKNKNKDQKMFGRFLGGNKKEDPKTQSVDPTIKHEKVLHNITKQLDKMDEEIEGIENKTVKLDSNIRELLAAKKKDQAKAKIAEMKGYQTQLQNMQTKRNALTQMKIQIENIQSDLSIGGLVIQARDLIIEATEQNDKIQTALEDYQDAQQEQQLAQERWKQMASIGVDENDVDETFAEYEKEVNLAQQQQLHSQFNQINPQKIQVPAQQQQYAPQNNYQNKQDVAFQSQIHDLLE